MKGGGERGETTAATEEGHRKIPEEKIVLQLATPMTCRIHSQGPNKTGKKKGKKKSKPHVLKNLGGC